MTTFKRHLATAAQQLEPRLQLAVEHRQTCAGFTERPIRPRRAQCALGRCAAKCAWRRGVARLARASVEIATRRESDFRSIAL